MPANALGTRICVIGNAGTGKSYLAQALASRLGLRYIDFDSLVLLPNWDRVPRAERRSLFDSATQSDGWTIDGHVRNAQPEEQLILSRADTVIWLDFSRRRVMTSTIIRTLRNTITRKPLWNGNIERWPMLFSRDHSIRWAWSNHQALQQEYENLFVDTANASRYLMRFRTRPQVNAWLRSLGA